jgi:hypothetical protein
MPHGKELLHDKGDGRCRGTPFAVRAARLHGNVVFAVRQQAFSLFFFLFYFI